MDYHLIRSNQYKAFKVTLFILGLVFFCLLFSVNNSFAQQKDLYSVEDQQIDVTADNPVQARENAIFEAQRTAFDVLAQRMLPDDEYQALPAFSDDVISSLVKGFSVKNERTAATRYRADFTIQFDQLRVERLFGLSGVGYSETTSRPLVVLPFLQMGSRLMIWEEPNPWRETWQSAVLDTGLVPIHVPLGDIADMADVPDASVFSGQAGNLTAIAERYGAGSVILAVAKSQGAALDVSEGLLVTLYSASRQGVERINDIMVPAGEGVSFSMAMNNVVNYLRNDWKQQTITLESVENKTLPVQVSFNGLGQWIEIKQRLEGLALIEKINSDSMTHNRADLTLEYTGTLEGLRLALDQSDLTLSETKVEGVGYLLRLQEGNTLY